ncbi:MAG: pilus (MSHA type) biogenesis protein MshL [Succinivibrionaceae bacterium]
MVKKVYCLSCLLFSIILSTGCSYKHGNPTEIRNELKEALLMNSDSMEVPDDVLSELSPDSPIGGDLNPYDNKRISVAAINIPAEEFFAQLMADSGASIVIHPEVSGFISLNLENVSIEEILDATYRMYGFRTERKGNIYYIYPSGVYTETIPVNYLALSRNSDTTISITNNTVSNSDDSSGSDSDSSDSSSSDSSNSNNTENNTSGVSVSTNSKSEFWVELQNTLVGIVGKNEGRMVAVNPQSSSVTVRAMPHEIEAVKQYITNAENSMRRQVVIEAKILEVSLNDSYEQGIEWNFIFDNLSKAKNFIGNSVFGNNNNLPTLPSYDNGLLWNNPLNVGNFGFGHTSKRFNLFINLLKQQGDVSTLSSPRITAINNQRSVMKIGIDQYFVTETSTQASATDSSYASTDVTLKPFFSGVALDVLPQIREDGRIILHIHPSVIEVQTSQIEVDFGNGKIQKLPTAKSDVRETDTIVEAKSGDVILIGGLMRQSKQEQLSKLPVLGDIPWFGELFTDRYNSDVKSELVILLRPVVVGPTTWNEEIKKASDLLQKWYPDENFKSTHDVVSFK